MSRCLLRSERSLFRSPPCPLPLPPTLSSVFRHSKDHVFHLVGRDVYWFSLPAHILFPQRTTQFAYPLDLAILLAVYIAVARNPKQKTDKDGDDGGDGNGVTGVGGRAIKAPDSGSGSGSGRLPGSPSSKDDANGKDKEVVDVQAVAGDLTNPQRLKLHMFAGLCTGLLPFVHVSAARDGWMEGRVVACAGDDTAAVYGG